MALLLVKFQNEINAQNLNMPLAIMPAQGNTKFLFFYALATCSLLLTNRSCWDKKDRRVNAHTALFIWNIAGF